MHRAQEQVRDFMRAMGQPTPNRPRMELTAARMKLRLDLIKEEVKELEEAIELATPNNYEDLPVSVTPEQIDALCDTLYVVYGMAVEMGIDLERFFELVHEANMKKGPGPVREDGKKLKPEGWEPPKIYEELVRAHKGALP